jgi:hypothetical protein
LFVPGGSNHFSAWLKKRKRRKKKKLNDNEFKSERMNEQTWTKKNERR